MIDFIKTWANQIIVAVIIATIFEMILPKGNNKKYIKMIIGIYVLFTVLQPIVSKITGKELEISSFNYEKYLEKNVLETSSEDFEDNNSNLIKQAYIDNIKNDIQTKISKKGYEVISCDVEFIEDEDREDYGAIEYIVLKIKNEYEETNKSTNEIEVAKVEIEINNSNTVIEESNISEKEKKEIIEYLAEEYSIDKQIIVID